MAQLIRDSAAGDEKAFELVLITYRPRLVQLAPVFMGAGLRAHEQGEDIVQEACKRAFRSITSFVPGDDVVASFESWLRVILLRVAQGAGRKLQRADLQRLDDDLPPSGVADSSTPSRSVKRREAANALAAAIQDLSASHREAVELVYFTGMTLEEAAQCIGVTRAALNSRLDRARGELRRLLEQNSPTRSGA